MEFKPLVTHFSVDVDSDKFDRLIKRESDPYPYYFVSLLDDLAKVDGVDVSTIEYDYAFGTCIIFGLRAEYDNEDNRAEIMNLIDKHVYNDDFHALETALLAYVNEIHKGEIENTHKRFNQVNDMCCEYHDGESGFELDWERIEQIHDYVDERKKYWEKRYADV
jgi:hypothetical protein